MSNRTLELNSIRFLAVFSNKVLQHTTVPHSASWNAEKCLKMSRRRFDFESAGTSFILFLQLNIGTLKIYIGLTET